MIGNITIGKNFANTLHYAAGKTAAKKAELVMTYNLVGQDWKSMGAEMENMANYSERCQKPVLHISLSFHPDENPTTQRMLEATDSYLKEMGIDKDSHQIAAYQHNDTHHNHLHLVINRINLDTAKAYDDSFIRYRNKEVCRKVEQDLALKPTYSYKVKADQQTTFRSHINEQKTFVPSVWEVREKDENRKQVRTFVHTEIEKALYYGASTKEKLALELAKVGIEATWKEDNKGTFVGASFRFNGTAITGNAAGYTATDLRDYFEKLSQGEQVKLHKSSVQAVKLVDATTTTQINQTPAYSSNITKKPTQQAQGSTQKPAFSDPTPGAKKKVHIPQDELKQYAAYANDLWSELKKQNKIRYESQAIEKFPFTDLVRGLRSRGVEQEKAFAVISHFQQFKNGQLPVEIKKEQDRFERSSQTYILLASKIKGNTDSRKLFLEALNVKRDGDRFYSEDNARLQYTASKGEMALIEKSPYQQRVFIPKTFSLDERKVLLKAIGGGTIEQSYYDLNPKRLKDALEDNFFKGIEKQLNANYVTKVLADSPMQFDDKLKFLHQRGILVEANPNGTYSLGYVGNISTGELKERVPATESFNKLFKEHNYNRDDYEKARLTLLSDRGQAMITLAQALDTKNTYVQDYIFKTATSLNQHLRDIQNPKDLLEALSWKRGDLRSSNNYEIKREINKIEKNILKPKLNPKRKL